MHELDVLEWAGGSHRPLPTIDTLDVDLLLEATSRHRIAGFFLRRLQMEPQPWANPTLLVGLTELQTRAEQIVQRQLHAMREIGNLYSPQSQKPLIALKGYSAYALTGAAATIRPSWDLDIISGDLEYLKNTLSNLDYELVVANDAYNYVKMLREDIFIEVHTYYPLYGFSAPISVADVLPTQNPGVWNQAVSMQCDQIPYSAIAEHATSAVLPEARELVIPDPTMTVFIRCVHTFKHCSFVFPKALATLKLGDLSEICELVKHPNFSQENFLKLVERFGAHYQVHFTGALMYEYFGFNPLPTLEAPIVGQKESVLIHRYYTFWTSIPWSLKNLLIREDSSEDILSYLKPNRIVASNSSSRRVFSVLSPGEGEPVERVITQTPEGKEIPIKFAVSWRDDALVFDVSVHTLPDNVSDEDPCDQVTFDFGGIGCSWVYRDRTKKYSLAGANETVGSFGIKPTEIDVSFSETGYNLRMGFAWDELDKLSPRPEVVPLVLSVMKWGEQKMRMRSMTMVPLSVVRV